MPEMIDGWQEKIDAAQQQTHLHINGAPIARIRYGSEQYYFGNVLDQVQHKIEITAPYCGDCAALIGQLHVCHPHGSCDIEECPQCHGQLLSCDCQFDEDEEEQPLL